MYVSGPSASKTGCPSWLLAERLRQMYARAAATSGTAPGRDSVHKNSSSWKNAMALTCPCAPSASCNGLVPNKRPSNENIDRRMSCESQRIRESPFMARCQGRLYSPGPDPARPTWRKTPSLGTHSHIPLRGSATKMRRPMPAVTSERGSTSSDCVASTTCNSLSATSLVSVCALSETVAVRTRAPSRQVPRPKPIRIIGSSILVVTMPSYLGWSCNTTNSVQIVFPQWWR